MVLTFAPPELELERPCPLLSPLHWLSLWLWLAPSGEERKLDLWPLAGRFLPLDCCSCCSCCWHLFMCRRLANELWLKSPPTCNSEPGAFAPPAEACLPLEQAEPCECCASFGAETLEVVLESEMYSLLGLTLSHELPVAPLEPPISRFAPAQNSAGLMASSESGSNPSAGWLSSLKCR